jgi:hypothetical protein
MRVDHIKISSYKTLHTKETSTPVCSSKEVPEVFTKCSNHASHCIDTSKHVWAELNSETIRTLDARIQTVMLLKMQMVKPPKTGGAQVLEKIAQLMKTLLHAFMELNLQQTDPSQNFKKVKVI